LIRLGVKIQVVSLKHPAVKLVQSDATALLDRVVYPSRAECAPWR
jgi:colanic acid/amylovoran biosynthesis glycosyltransferase